MAARPRSVHKKNWPDGLYERSSGYFSWRNPLTDQELGIGRVGLAEACAQAVEANLHIRELTKKPRLVDRLTGIGNRTVEALVDAHDKKLQQRVKDGELAEITLRTIRVAGRAAKRAWGDRIAERVTTLDVAGLLGEYKDAGKRRMAQSIRSYMTGLFTYAEAEGWIPRGTNPVTITDQITVTVKRARLSLDDFRTIYDAAGALDRWVCASMSLALVSLQRREDIAAGEFRNTGPKSTCWVQNRMFWVVQQKVEHSSGTRLRIPFELELHEFGWSLEWAIAQCRDNVVSPWLIHHARPRGRHCRPGDRVWIDTITKAFRKARDRTSLRWPDDQDPPTFHEIRSLGARLYDAQGNVSVQSLLGHTDPETTALYIDPRDRLHPWSDIKVA